MSENIRQIFFDPGSTFCRQDACDDQCREYLECFDSSGIPTLIANVGADTEGMDIASSAFGPYAGDLLVASEGTGQIHAITPGGGVLLVASGLTEAETVSTVPLNLGLSGNPLEGFYVANYAVDIQKAGSDQFAGLQGDVIVTGEFGSNSPVTALHWDGSSIVQTLVGNLPNQSEDGIFVTTERIHEVGTPEPVDLGDDAARLCRTWLRRPSRAQAVGCLSRSNRLSSGEHSPGPPARRPVLH